MKYWYSHDFSKIILCLYKLILNLQLWSKQKQNCDKIEINFQSDIFNFLWTFILFGQWTNIQAMVILRKHFIPYWWRVFGEDLTIVASWVCPNHMLTVINAYWLWRWIYSFCTPVFRFYIEKINTSSKMINLATIFCVRQ